VNREQARQLIKDTFEATFNKEKFIIFIKDLLNKIEEFTFTYRGNFIPDAFEQYISTLERIGKYTDGENEIDLLIVKLKKEKSLERARTMQRNFIAWYLNGSRGEKQKDAALVAFVSPDEEDWRFSLVKMDYRFEEEKAGMVKVKEKFTPARRWSFLVGKNEKSHTAQSKIVPILEDDEHNPTLTQLEEAFNIEKVTKEFFKKYRDLFIRTVDELDKIIKKDEKVRKDFELKNINTVDFAKKLLGQIVFLYFLQKKGWFGVPEDKKWGEGDKNFIRNLFLECSKDKVKNFFNDYLEYLFYDALNNNNRKSADPAYYERFNCKIPFLNGGLFEPIGGYDWVHTDMILQNELFYNNNRTPEGDEGDGILNVFDRFNFTVKEDEPLEKEVAIDPELLGRLYEKFNAIRPDNFYEYKEALVSGKRHLEKQFNKKFGVYYTPREIVHYMCQESLINYLHTSVNQELMKHPAKTSRQIKLIGTEDPEQISFQTDEEIVSKDDIQMLIKYGEQFAENEAVIEEKGQETKTYKHKLPETIRENAKIIDEVLKNVKVCDPAVGSGAFPVGMMHEIVKTRNVLTTFLSLQGKEVTKESQTGDHFVYAHDDNRTIYNFKRECIEKSLYGVDIDPGACEIAKLRLWLSLVVDEEDITQIKPLPNLDYKIMQGDSLISEFLGINFDIDKDQQSGTLKFESEIDPLIEQCQEKKNKFLNEPDRNKKEHLKQEIESLIVEIFEEKLKKQRSQYFSQLKSIEEKYSILPNEEQQNKYIAEEKEKLYKEKGFNLEQVEQQLKEYTSGRKIRPFFPWKLYFAEVFQGKGGFDVVIANPPYVNVEKIDDNIKKSIHHFKTAYQKYDLYVLFYEKSTSLLRRGGVLTFISSNKFLSQGYGFLLRKYLLNFEINKIINFNFNIFKSAIVRTCIFQLSKKQVKDNKIKVMEINSKNDKPKFLEERYNYINQSIFEKTEENNFRINLTKDKITILNKIRDKSERVEDICSVNYGLRPSSEKLNRKKEHFIHDSNTDGAYKKYFEGKDMGYWRIKRSYFLDYRHDVMYNPMFIELFENEKLVGLRTLSDINKLRFIYDNEGLFCNDSVVILTPWYLFKNVTYPTIKRNITIEKINNSKKYSIKYLQAILNSKLIKFYVNELLYDGTHFYPDHMKSLPIKICREDEQNPLIGLVDKILAITKDDDYLENSTKQAKVREYKNQIDWMIYKLYKLKEDEIKIVEGK